MDDNSAVKAAPDIHNAFESTITCGSSCQAGYYDTSTTSADCVGCHLRDPGGGAIATCPTRFTGMCTPCPNNTMGTAPGAVSGQVCVPCASGSVSLEGSDECVSQRQAPWLRPPSKQSTRPGSSASTRDKRNTGGRGQQQQHQRAQDDRREEQNRRLEEMKRRQQERDRERAQERADRLERLAKLKEEKKEKGRKKK
mmetsp:Transcript_48863/g.66596  ORF Transcript_48863/g.66596 Transcript_48863/m.66596 type:complete len:197 (-) Transcript_48863:46-636(-)